MEIISTCTEERGLQMTGVRFVPGEGKREKRAADTMNRYYQTLEEAVRQYACTCVEACSVSRYCCEIQVRGEQILTVTVYLAHRIPGQQIRRKKLVHRWENGLLTKENFT